MAVLRLLISCSVLTFVFLVVTFVHRPWLICGILMDPHWSITNIYHLIYYDPTSKLQNNNYHINHEHFTVCKALMFKQDYSRLKSHCWLIRLVTLTSRRALSPVYKLTCAEVWQGLTNNEHTITRKLSIFQCLSNCNYPFHKSCCKCSYECNKFLRYVNTSMDIFVKRYSCSIWYISMIISTYKLYNVIIIYWYGLIRKTGKCSIPMDLTWNVWYYMEIIEI